MELRQLRAFVAVATEGHFGRAAAGLNLTQPGVTLRIQALERELGAQLLDRSAREVRLTEAGTLLLPHARSLLRLEDRALRELKDQSDGIAGHLRISYLSYGPVTRPGQLVTEFRRRYPNVHVETMSGHSDLNIERLREGIVDAAFIHPGIARVRGGIPDGIAVRLLSRVSVMLALSPNHPLARLEQIPVMALRREPLIMYPSPYHSFNLTLEGWLAYHTGAEPNVVGREPPEHAFEAVARSTSLITFANGSRVESAPVPGIAYKRMVPEPLIDFGVAYFRDDVSPMLVNMLRLIDDMARGEPGDVPEGSELLTADDSPTSLSRMADIRRPRETSALG